MKFKLLLGDCLERMKEIEDNSIDLCLTDPPYGTTKCKWDCVIPFEPMWGELKRIVKPSGVICLFGSEPFSSHLRLSNLKMFKYDWYWHKTKTPDFLHAKNKPMNYIENCLVFSSCKPTKINYYPQGLKPCGKKAGRYGDNSGVIKSGKIKRYIVKFTNYPKTLVAFNNEFKKNEKHHETQKPVALLEYLIKTYTLENETVLDFTMGSGSTGVACRNLKRNFIGIEQDKNYFSIAKRRIRESA